MSKKKKDIVLEQVLVENYAAEGKSLARREGKVIFIEGAVPGDVVDVRLGKNKKDWAEGYPLRFHTYSKERATPFCQHFGVCGGCQWQMLPFIYRPKAKEQKSLFTSCMATITIFHVTASVCSCLRYPALF